MEVSRGAVRRASTAIAEVAETAAAVKDAIHPGAAMEFGVDVLGIVAPSAPGSLRSAAGSLRAAESMASAFEEEDLFEVDVIGEGGDLSQLIAGEGLTSPVLRDEEGSLDWAAELLLLTHEPLRRDMLEMQRALQPQFFGNLPESWRVRAFFRFFTAWCSLVSQQHAVEVAVHSDWLMAPTGRLDGDQRSEILSYHRAIELDMLGVSRLEKKLMDELRDAAAWTSSEPWSEVSQELRDRLQALCAQIRMHLATQESLVPEVLREFWGASAPPQLVTRSIAAAKKAEAAAARGRDAPKLLPWLLHYLQRRDPQRSRLFVAQLPLVKRLRLALGGGQAHVRLLQHLRCIVLDEEPAGGRDSASGPSLRLSAAADDADGSNRSSSAAEGMRSRPGMHSAADPDPTPTLIRPV